MVPIFETKFWADKTRVIVWVVVLVAAALFLLLLFRGQRVVIRNPESYQAVFLDNGQVYFGKLHSLNRDFLSLTDIYYLRAGTVQQARAAGSSSGSEAEVGAVDLIKLGAELHAPRDEMIINKSHVLFYEDLGENGQIMQLIRKHQSGK